MQVLKAYNVNVAYPRGMRLLQDTGIVRESRNGPVKVCPEPVTTHYAFPTERVLFDPQRNANPFFHLFEALWMLTGANDVGLPAYFVPRMKDYSDDGEKFHGAYGFRWRRHWVDTDQLNDIVKLLRANPDDRRCVLSMWDPSADLGKQGKDFPCNVVAKFELDAKHEKLNMIVFNRSNDIIWGCYGANVVQFSILQEYLAARVGVAVGWYEQISSNFHAYLDSWTKMWPMQYHTESPYHATKNWVKVEPLVTAPERFYHECLAAVESVRKDKLVVGQKWHNNFFPRVAQPMAGAYYYYRHGEMSLAISTLTAAIGMYGNIDWLVAGKQWMERVWAARRTEGSV